MVAQHYRWDFIGLSTDEKPTPQTSEKVVDGSTFYCSDNSKLYVFCGSQWYEKTVSGGGSYELPIASAETLGGVKVGSNLSIDSETGVLSATNTTYSAGSNVSISDENVISATDTTYTAGSNVSISDENVISATDTTYSNFVGTDGTTAGTAGLVPAPATTDAGKFLKADGTWDTAGGGGSDIFWLTISHTANIPYVSNTFAEVKDALDAGKTLAFRSLTVNSLGGYGDTLFIAWDTTPIPTTGSQFYIRFMGFGGWNNGNSANPNNYGITVLQAYLMVSPNNQTLLDSGVIRFDSIAGYYYPNSANPTAGDFRLVSQKMLVDGTGVLSDLKTSSKTNIVSAINEVSGRITNNGTTVPDTSTKGSVGSVLSCVNSGTPEIYMCTAVSGSTYTWTKVI